MRVQSTSFLARVWSVRFKDLPPDQGLESHAYAINVMFGLADTSHRNSEHQRINAGRMLIKVQALVLEQQGPGQWDAWCKTNIKRGRRDIYRVMKLAAADDPQLAHQIEIEAKRAARIIAKVNEVPPGALGQTLQQSDQAAEPKIVPIRRNTTAPAMTEDDEDLEAAATAMEAALDAFGFTFNRRIEAVHRLAMRVRKEQDNASA